MSQAVTATPSASEPIIVTQDATMEFGGLKAVNGVSLRIDQGEVVALIGPNGAGKTTMFNLMTGIYKATSGSVVFRGQELRGRKPHQVCEAGVARTFQNIRLFDNMTALENVMVGRHVRTSAGPLQAVLRTRKFKQEEQATRDAAFRWLRFVGLADKANEYAVNLAYGQQRRLEIARALATDPVLLLLDEPAAGMNASESADLTRLVREIKALGITVLLIEHDMKVVMGIADRIYVLDFGQLIAQGLPADIQRDTRVIEAYLGRGALEMLQSVDAGEDVSRASDIGEDSGLGTGLVAEDPDAADLDAEQIAAVDRQELGSGEAASEPSADKTGEKP